MSRTVGVRRVGVGASPVDWAPDALPEGVRAMPAALTAADRGRSTAILYEPTKTTGRAAFLMHPRVDFQYHYLIPPLLRRGISVWAQNGRFANNDLTLVNERLLLDVAAGMGHLKRRFADITMIGNSGGASLAGFYLQQAGRVPSERLDASPSGTRVDLGGGMPLADRLVLVAPHPGQGDWLSKAIDPAVTDEHDPSHVDPALDLYAESNGFGQGYDPGFLERYRAAQLRRIARIDDEAWRLIQQRRSGGGRASVGAQILVVHRTDADPRCVDLSLEPSDRLAGSILGPHPERSNNGLAGLGRLSTPDAWLSNWSINTTNTALRLTLPEVSLPVAHISYTADQTVFPSDVEAARAAVPSLELTADLVADHYGFDLEGSSRIAAEPVAAIVEEL